MKLKIIAISLTLMFLATCMNFPTVTAPYPPYDKFGPRVKDIIFNVAGDVGKEAQMLEDGLIDLMDWAVPFGKINTWKNTEPYKSEIVLGDYAEAGWYEYDLNLQMWPIGHGTMNGVKNTTGGAAPTTAMDWTLPPGWTGSYWIDYSDQRDRDAREFRRALAHLTDRGSISSQFPGTITPMETFIYPMLSSWLNPNAPKYLFGLDAARGHLDDGGFMDYRGDTMREYCPDFAVREAWKNAGRNKASPPAGVEDIPDIQLWSRSDDPPRKYAGNILFQYMEAVNIDVDYYEGSYGYCTSHAWKYYDYHIYTGGWSGGSMPDHYEVLFASYRDTYPATDADNYNRYHRQAYDVISEKFKSSLDLVQAKNWLDQCEYMIHDDVACIPLYTMSGYVAHRKNYGNFPGESQYAGLEWLGFANESGYGFYGGNFGFSSINAHLTGYERGGTLRHGLVAKPDKLDPVDSESFYEALILSKIYEPLIVRDPYNTTRYIPWLCSSFTTGTWNNTENSPAGRNCSKLTVNLLSPILWHDNEKLTPVDVKFTYEYKQAAKSVSEYSNLRDFHHCNYTGNKIDICFNLTSFLVQSWVAGVTIIPEHIFKDYPPTLPGDTTEPGSWAFAPDEEDKLIGTGPFRCVKDGVVGRIDKVEGEYYHLVANPTYFRELVQPDFVNHPLPGSPTLPGHDNKVDIYDFSLVIIKFGLASPWTGDPVWGPIADVDKNYFVDLDDIMEVGARVPTYNYAGGYPSFYG